MTNITPPNLDSDAEPSSPPAETKQPSVLVVDDDPRVTATLRRLLTKKGFEVFEAGDGSAALEILQGRAFDVLFTDLDMPGIGGVELLRRVKRSHPQTQTVLMTGNPTVDTAMEAANSGVLAYLTKPFDHEKVIEVASRVSNSSPSIAPNSFNSFRLNAAQRNAQFEAGLEGLYIHYQPVVCWSSKSTYSYEALMRTRCQTIPHPGVFLELAEGLGRVHELGRAVRNAIAEEIRTNAARPPAVFVNLHPEELMDPDLYDPKSPLAQHAAMIVLEITEREDLRGMTDVHERIVALKALGYRIAIDDIGAGYSGLNSFVDLDPHMVKIDMGLIRGIDTCKKRQKLVSSLVSLAREMDIDVVVEGVETEAERDTLLALNCDLLQGYLFCRPEAPFAPPRLS